MSLTKSCLRCKHHIECNLNPNKLERNLQFIKWLGKHTKKRYEINKNGVETINVFRYSQSLVSVIPEKKYFQYYKNRWWSYSNVIECYRVTSILNRIKKNLIQK